MKLNTIGLMLTTAMISQASYAADEIASPTTAESILLQSEPKSRTDLAMKLLKNSRCQVFAKNVSSTASGAEKKAQKTGLDEGSIISTNQRNGGKINVTIVQDDDRSKATTNLNISLVHLKGEKSGNYVILQPSTSVVAHVARGMDGEPVYLADTTTGFKVEDFKSLDISTSTSDPAQLKYTMKCSPKKN